MRTSRLFGLAAALTLVSAWPLLRQFASALPSDLGDPVLETWILWWNARAMPLTTAWWNAPMYFPLPGAFSFSESLLGLTPLTTPLQWLGASPVAAHNAAFLLSGPLAALAAYQLAWQVTKRRDASLIAGLAFGFSPYRIAQLAHMQVLWACWMPFALAALHDYLDTKRVKPLIWFAVCWLVNGLTNAYFLIYFPVLVACWMVWFVRRWRDVAAISAAAVVASLPMAPLIAGYSARHAALGLSRGINEIRQFSADMTALFAGSDRAWLSSLWTIDPGPEGELYPGLALMSVVLLGVIAAVRSRDGTAGDDRKWRMANRLLAGAAILAGSLAVAVWWTGGWDLTIGPVSSTAHRPSRFLTYAFWLLVLAAGTSRTGRRAWHRRSPIAFYAIGAATMFLFALGPEPRVWGHQFLYKPPYAWLMMLPGAESVRVPARFGLLMLVCLCQAGALAYARLLAVPRRGVLATVAVLILAEGWIPVLPVVPLPPAPAVPSLPAGTPILELPVGPGWEDSTGALLQATRHGHPIVNGFGGHRPPHFDILQVALLNDDATLLPALQTIGTVAIYVDPARDKDGRNAALVARTPGAVRLPSTDPGPWTLLPAMIAPAALDAGNPLTPVSVRATIADENSRWLFDGNLRTGWIASVPEGATSALTMDFGRTVTVSEIQLDQGAWPAGIPVNLTVSVSNGASVPSMIWSGSVGGSALLAAIRDPRRIPVTIHLANSVAGRTLILTGRQTNTRFNWVIAELKIYGR